MSTVDTLRILIERLTAIFENEQETLARVLHYLTEEIRAYREEGKDGPAFTMLKCMLENSSFKQYARYLAEDTKTAEEDEKFKQIMGIIYSQMMDGSLVLDDVVPPDQICLINSSESVALGLIRAIALMPSLSQLQMVAMINNFGSHRLARSLATTVNTVNTYGVNRVTVALSAIFLTPKIIQCIRNWWNGEITGNRCCKIIIDEVSTVAGSVGGGYVGALIGIPLGPVGILAGGIIGGMLGGEVLSRFSDWLTQQIFNIPKDVALENAYVYFGIDRGASNHEINVAYRQKCMQHHPDKGGNSEEFHKVQIHMATIKASKGQLYS